MLKVSTDIDFVKAKTRRVVGVDVFIESNVQPETAGPKVERRWRIAGEGEDAR